MNEKKFIVVNLTWFCLHHAGSACMRAGILSASAFKLTFPPQHHLWCFFCISIVFVYVISFGSRLSIASKSKRSCVTLPIIFNHFSSRILDFGARWLLTTSIAELTKNRVNNERTWSIKK